MSRILFLCAGNSGRSQMAQCFARAVAPPGVDILSAGDRLHPLHPKAREVMKAQGFDLPETVPATLDQIKKRSIDIVVTLCNQARESCPALPGSPARIHWGLADPAESNSDNESAFLQVRDQIRRRVDALFLQGFFESILQLRQSFGALLDNLTDGVMAHDLSRNIFFFNRAAQEITGYSYDEVIGLDCHEVFHGRFCGGKCSYCEDDETLNTKLRYPVTITRRNGTKREVEMSVVPLKIENVEVEGALIIFRDITEVIQLRRVVDGEKGFQGIIGRDPKMRKVFDAIRDLADVDVPVLIQGESGTGKEMVAYALHALSRRSNRMFVPINCGALPESILESELFGHVRGAFTGAIRDKKGRFEIAHQGTLFLDETGEITPTIQVKLLRVLQEKSFIPVGGEKITRVDVRIISASNKDLKSLTREGLFREDLYYRLAVIPIYLPPLRERIGDIPLLVEHFMEKMGSETGKVGLRVSAEVMTLLMAHRWPGNIRELRNAIQYALIKCKGEMLEVNHLPPEIYSAILQIPEKKPGRRPKLILQDVENALALAGENKAKAARILGVSRTTLYRYLAGKKL